MVKLLFLALLIFTGCNEDKPSRNYNGELLLEQKCASCHDINMPPIISEDELAPPMMAVAFHVKNFVTPSNESQRVAKAIEFVVDYVENPSLEKSFCDKKSLERYGLMPSQKENVTNDETKAIATYMFKHFTQENLSKRTQEQAEFDAVPAGKKIALKYKCLGCHRIDKKIVGPSFISIAKKHENSTTQIKESIKNGSKGKYKDSKGAVMPAFKNISEKELELLSLWILDTNS